MSTKQELLEQAAKASFPHAEAIYKEIISAYRTHTSFHVGTDLLGLASPISEHADIPQREAELRQQETALVKLAELYQSEK